MANQIIPKKSVVAARQPSDLSLALGEISVNHADKIIYARHPGTGTVQAITTPPGHQHTLADITDLSSLEYVVDNVVSPSENYKLEITNDGDIKVSNAAGTLATTLEITSSASRLISFPDKGGTVALLDDLSTAAASDSLISADASQKITLNDNGSLTYEHGSDTTEFDLPTQSGVLAVRGGDTIISSAQPANPYSGLRWVDSDLMRSFDWIVDSLGVGSWVETGVGADGRQLDLRLFEGYIQWRYVGDTGWVNLVALTELKGEAGADGSSVELRLTSEQLQWKATNAVTWNDLIDLNQLKGPAGSDAAVTAANIQSALGYLPDNPINPRTPTEHFHLVDGVDRYYTRAETNSLLAGKQAAGNYSVQGHKHQASDIEGVLSVDQIPVLPSQVPVVATSIAALTTAQQDSILAGTVLITADGKRYVYKGEGTKTTETSYIVLADIAPTWSAITNKPTNFTPTTHGHSVAEITGLAAVATSGEYSALIGAPQIPAAQVQTDWTAETGMGAILNKPILADVATSGDYNDLINKPTTIQRIAKSAWATPYHYYGVAAVGTAENQANWTVQRITTNSAGQVTSTGSATGAWTNRSNLTYT
jgi:hypothetical protein